MQGVGEVKIKLDRLRESQKTQPSSPQLGLFLFRNSNEQFLWSSEQEKYDLMNLAFGALDKAVPLRQFEERLHSRYLKLKEGVERISKETIPRITMRKVHGAYEYSKIEPIIIPEQNQIPLEAVPTPADGVEPSADDYFEESVDLEHIDYEEYDDDEETPHIEQDKVATKEHDLTETVQTTYVEIVKQDEDQLQAEHDEYDDGFEEYDVSEHHVIDNPDNTTSEPIIVNTKLEELKTSVVFENITIPDPIVSKNSQLTENQQEIQSPSAKKPLPPIPVTPKQEKGSEKQSGSGEKDETVAVVAEQPKPFSQPITNSRKEGTPQNTPTENQSPIKGFWNRLQKAVKDLKVAETTKSPEKRLEIPVSTIQEKLEDKNSNSNTIKPLFDLLTQNEDHIQNETEIIEAEQPVINDNTHQEPLENIEPEIDAIQENNLKREAFFTAQIEYEEGITSTTEYLEDVIVDVTSQVDERPENESPQDVEQRDESVGEYLNSDETISNFGSLPEQHFNHLNEETLGQSAPGGLEHSLETLPQDSVNSKRQFKPNDEQFDIFESASNDLSESPVEKKTLFSSFSFSNYSSSPSQSSSMYGSPKSLIDLYSPLSPKKREKLVEDVFVDASTFPKGWEDQYTMLYTDKRLMSHPLLDKLRRSMIDLVASSLTNPPQPTISVYRTSVHLPVIIQSIYSIFLNRTKPTLLKGERDLCSIFSKIGSIKKEKVLQEFSSFKDVRTLDAKKLKDKDFLFIQYLLQRKLLAPSCAELFNSKGVLSECYDETSIINACNSQAINDILNMISKSVNFEIKFEFDLSKQAGESKAEGNQALHTTLQSNIKTLLQYIIELGKSEKLPVELVTDESRNHNIGRVVRSLIMYIMKSIFSDKLLSESKWKAFAKAGTLVSHPWHLIQTVASGQLSKAGAIIKTGYTFQSIVLTIDSTVKKNNQTKQQLLDDKFFSFVAYCLNYQILHDAMKFIFKNLDILEKNYRGDSVMVEPSSQEKIMSILQPLSKVRFTLNYY